MRFFDYKKQVWYFYNTESKTWEEEGKLRDYYKNGLDASRDYGES